MEGESHLRQQYLSDFYKRVISIVALPNRMNAIIFITLFVYRSENNAERELFSRLTADEATAWKI